jgi:hypothetical protein
MSDRSESTSAADQLSIADSYVLNGDKVGGDWRQETLRFIAVSRLLEFWRDFVRIVIKAPINRCKAILNHSQK